MLNLITHSLVQTIFCSIHTVCCFTVSKRRWRVTSMEYGQRTSCILSFSWNTGNLLVKV